MQFFHLFKRKNARVQLMFLTFPYKAGLKKQKSSKEQTSKESLLSCLLFSVFRRHEINPRNVSCTPFRQGIPLFKESYHKFTR